MYAYARKNVCMYGLGIEGRAGLGIEGRAGCVDQCHLE
jgi:hypothetical protein